MDTALDDDDRRLIAALQVRPRASWTELGAVLGPSPLTLARRWARLSGSGVAWLTAAPNLQAGTAALGHGVALVEMRIPPGQVLPIAGELAQVPEIATIDVTAGSRELVLTVIAGDDELKRIDKEIRDIVNEAARFSQDSPEPEPSELWTDILVDA